MFYIFLCLQDYSVIWSLESNTPGENVALDDNLLHHVRRSRLLTEGKNSD